MKQEIFKIENIHLDLDIKNKAQLLNKIAEKAFEGGVCRNKEQVLKGLNEREAMATTNLGKGICIPHTKNDAIENPSIFIFRLKESIFWNEEEEKINMAISLIMPKQNIENIHIKVLTSLSRKLIYDSFIKELLEGKSRDEIYRLIHQTLQL